MSSPRAQGAMPMSRLAVALAVAAYLGSVACAERARSTLPSGPSHPGPAGLAPPDPPDPGSPHARSDGSSVLNEAEQRALHDALNEEYRAWTTYDQVIRDFGPERPFIDIRESEARHIDALRTLFQRYTLEMPENTWPGRVPRFTSIREACDASAQGEIELVALYERLMQSTNRPDILAVFDNLQRASQENHLPAFRRCAARRAGRARLPT